MTKIEYVSGSIAREFRATDGSNYASIPVSDLAPGCTGMLLVLETEDDAKQYDPDVDVTRIEVGDI